jgi:hypothetical protein
MLLNFRIGILICLLVCYLTTLLVSRRYRVDDRMINGYGEFGGMRLFRVSRSTRRKAASGPFCPPRAPLSLPRIELGRSGGKPESTHLSCAGLFEVPTAVTV